jgi:hypothetical protein
MAPAVVNVSAPGYRPVHETRTLGRESTAMTPARRLLLLAPAAVLAAAMLLPTGWESPVPLCLVKGLTGLDCPGCGMTRAFLFIGHGRFADAAALHPFGIPAFLIVAGMAATGIVRIIRNRPT